jgi:hypothetical protein
MKEEYNFSKGLRGKFHQPGMLLIPPVHLEPEIARYLVEKAEARGTSVSDLVNQLLKKDIELIEAAAPSG